MALVLTLAVISVFAPTCAIRSDIRPIGDVVREFGYDMEAHTIHTSDGYMLTTHRLLGRSREQTHAEPVVLVEGMLQSSASNLAKGKGIAYSLVDQGFDVWLTNYRGNLYSRQHETISPDSPAFWNFTLHEMGTKDLPATIDYVLTHTQHNQLIYLGFSMGTTMFWVLASSLPQYQNKVSVMVAVDPVARPSNMRLLKNDFSRTTIYALFKTLWTLKKCEVMSYGDTTSSILSRLCSGKFRFTCERFVDKMNRFQKEEMEVDAAFKMIPYSPAGISVKVILHFIQIACAKRFQQFDYGSRGNRQMYGSTQPPQYDLQRIQLPVYLVYSDKDKVATKQDIEWLADQLPRRPTRKIESVRNFSHLDFSLNFDLRALFQFEKYLNLLTAKLSVEKDIRQEEMNSSFKIQEQTEGEIFALNERIEALQANLRQRDLSISSVIAENLDARYDQICDARSELIPYLVRYGCQIWNMSRYVIPNLARYRIQIWDQSTFP
ncbi:lipase 3-like [Macrosteles quadrilineatus]|uniref:lipase 3-like n=1 Tax=Macrosteles quadrilineatus TaxID=74068 RepID=UPI0023E24F51|nr:lipase 3-like [Macrosteles quadrilineatus]